MFASTHTHTLGPRARDRLHCAVLYSVNVLYRCVGLRECETCTQSISVESARQMALLYTQQFVAARESINDVILRFSPDRARLRATHYIASAQKHGNLHRCVPVHVLFNAQYINEAC